MCRNNAEYDSNLGKTKGKELNERDSTGIKHLNLPSLFTVLFTLFVFPIIIHDRYFDINRFKVHCLMLAVLLLCPAWIIHMIRGFRFGERWNPNRQALKFWIIGGCFLVICFLSALRAGLNDAVLWGSEGRYSGLFFLLTCSVIFCMTSTLNGRGRSWLGIIRVSTLFIALLGIINTLGRDPFNFYIGIKKGQEDYFVSTIGNTDFFGAWVALLYPYCTSIIQIKNRSIYFKTYIVTAACVMSLAVVASRSDCAFGAMLLICLLRIALAGDDWQQTAYAHLLCSVFWISFPIMKWLLLSGWFDIRLKGIAAFICKYHVATLLSLLHVSFVYICLKKQRLGEKNLGSKKSLRILALLLILVALIYILVAYYFTIINPSIELGFAEDLVRFNDNWGSRRGFIWTRSLRAFSDFSWIERLLGKGVDNARSILTPYFDKPAMLSFGVFNDAHNQFLQYLITTGIFGIAVLVCFHFNLIKLAYTNQKANPDCTDDLVALVGYTLIALLSVSQPILLATYACLAGLTVSDAV